MNTYDSFDNLWVSINERHKNGEGWEAIARTYNNPIISRAHIYKMWKNKWEPDRNDLRAALGLHRVTTVQACPICGEVHLHKHGEQTYDPATSALYNPSAQVVRPMPKPRRPSAPKIAIRKDDIRSAARTILRHYNKEDVAELAALLTK